MFIDFGDKSLKKNTTYISLKEGQPKPKLFIPTRVRIKAAIFVKHFVSPSLGFSCVWEATFIFAVVFGSCIMFCISFINQCLMTWREQYKYLPVRVSTTSCNNIRLAHWGLVVAAVEIQKGNFDNEVFGYLLKSATL